MFHFFVSLPEGTLQTRFVPKDCGAITENNYVWEPQKPKPRDLLRASEATG